MRRSTHGDPRSPRNEERRRGVRNNGGDGIVGRVEQEYVSVLYGRLDTLREQAAGRLATTLRESGGTPQARSQREHTTAMYSEQVARLSAVENGLCFGRLDFDTGERRYIGRIGLF